MSKTIYNEVALIDLPDDELLNLISFLWEEQKRLDERMAADQHIQRVVDELNQYKKEKYLDTRKEFRSKLKAARYLAQARGLNFKLPEVNSES